MYIYMYVYNAHCPFFMMIIILDPTLTLSNLTPLLERISWYNMDWWMDIPGATVSMIHSSGGDDSQRGQRFCEVYLSDHPAPSWKQVAEALYRPDLNGQECIEELEVVQKKYLRGESINGGHELNHSCLVIIVIAIAAYYVHLDH